MRYITIITLITLIVSGILMAQGPNDPIKPAETVTDSKARISFDNPNWNFGYCSQGNFRLVHTYKVSNIGEDTLHIEGIRPTCGCTAAPMEKRDLAPGETTDLTAYFRTRGQRRATSKSIRISSNDPTQRLASVRFSTNFDTIDWFDPTLGIRVVPDPLFINYDVGENMINEVTVRLENLSAEKLKLKVIEYSEGVIEKPEFKKDVLKSEKSTEMKVRLNADYDVLKPIQASIIVIALDDKDEEVIRFSIPIIGGGRQ